MKSNRRTSKRLSVVTDMVMHFGAVGAMLFVMVIMYVMAQSNCSQLLTKIRLDEKLLDKLEDERRQQSTRWEQMKTPERLEAALLSHGLSMKVPRADQNVYMKPDGTPYPGQLSVTAAKRRNGMNAVQYSPARKRR